MMSLQHVLWRVILASLGFVLAVAASVVVVIAGLGVVAGGEHLVSAPDAVGLFAVVMQLMRGAVIAPVLATVVWPGWLIAGALGEATGTRSLAVHLIVAAAIAVGGVVGSLPLVGLAHVQTTAAAGLVAGFVHWLVAGRSAGLVRRTSASALVEGAPRPPHA